MSTIFDELETALESKGPEAAVDQLIAELRKRDDDHGLFYALLLKKRLELGLPPMQVGSTDSIPKEKQPAYEDGIREAARTAGTACLARNDFAGAWPYFRMIHEPEPMVAAIETAKLEPDDTEAWQNLVGIAWNEAVSPKRGFDLILQRFGTCSAITTLGQGMPEDEEVRNHCIRALVRNVYEETSDRVMAEMERRDGSPPTKTTLVRLIQDRNWLFEEDAYHIDLSHLSSVVQYSIHLPACEETRLAIELCEYGRKLSPRFIHPGDPPFEDQYRDYGVYLRIIADENVEEGVAHFRHKAETADPAEAGTLPAEVLVTLLSRLGRHGDAVQAFTRHLGQANHRQLTCPGIQELCTKLGDYRPYQELALRQGNLVNFTAALLQTRTNQPAA